MKGPASIATALGLLLGLIVVSTAFQSSPRNRTPAFAALPLEAPATMDALAEPPAEGPAPQPERLTILPTPAPAAPPPEAASEALQTDEGETVSPAGAAEETAPPLGAAEETAPPLGAAEETAPPPEPAAETAPNRLATVVEVGRGDTLLDLLLTAGVERGEAVAAVDALRPLFNPRALQVGQEITVDFARAGAFSGFQLSPEPGRLVTVNRTTDSGFAAGESRQQLTRAVIRAGGAIASSLYEAATAAGIPATIVVEMIRALSYDVDFQRDLQPGDHFDVLFERFHDSAGEALRHGNLLYASLVLSGKRLAILRHVDQSGAIDYYNERGESVRKALLRTPIDGARLSSGFGMRQHPILGYSKMHRGLDFAAPAGTPIMAAGAGKVEKAGMNGAYGNFVRIRHNTRYATAYAHMSRIAPAVRPGANVKQGQIIGYVGSTGRSTGPHLHYELVAGGAQINPMSVKMTGGAQLVGKDFERFRAATLRPVQQMLATLPVAVAAAGGTTKAANN